MDYKSRYQLALEAFDRTADELGLPMDIREAMKSPEEVSAISVPVEMDSGETREFQAFRVRHSSARGPARGGIRCRPGMSVEEVSALAMRFTWRWALLDIPLGGGECGVAAVPDELSHGELVRLAGSEFLRSVPLADAERALTGGIGNVASDGPRACDKATACGTFHLVSAACENLGVSLKKARVAVQGFGRVGSTAALMLADAGALVVAAGDAHGSIYAARGLDARRLAAHKERSGSVIGFMGSEPITDCELLALNCDILVEAALGNAIHCRNVAAIQAKIIAEASNTPVTAAADRVLESKGAFLIPDILCTAGGPAVSYYQWLGSEQAAAPEPAELSAAVERVMRRSFQEVLAFSQERKVSMRKAASMLAVSRVAAAVQQPALQS